MKIEIIFTNTTQYHSSQPGEARVTLNGEFTSGPTGFPCIRTRSLPIMAQTGDEEGTVRPRYLPIMPANSLRHNLREGMIEPIFDAFRGNVTLSDSAYAAALSGNASGNPDGIQASFEEVRTIGKHPFLGVFGGGPRMIAGRLQVHDAMPITPDTLRLLGDYEDKVVSGRLTQVVFKRRVDPVLDADAEDAELITNAEQAITEWSNKFASGKEGEDSARGLRSFPAHEVVIPGLNWLWRVGLRKPTKAQAGLLLLAIKRMHKSMLGGMNSQGYGLISISSVIVDGEEVWAGNGFDESSDVINSYFAAWAEASDEITANDFEAFAMSKKASKKEAEDA